jgi:hypothetical protein
LLWFIIKINEKDIDSRKQTASRAEA